MNAREIGKKQQAVEKSRPVERCPDKRGLSVLCCYFFSDMEQNYNGTILCFIGLVDVT